LLHPVRQIQHQRITVSNEQDWHAHGDYLHRVPSN
jgi:hypothetical protein